MIPHLKAARHISEYILWLQLDDGTEGEVDLREELWGPIFEPLLDPSYFRRFTVHPELQTVVWENGADFSPEFLYRQIRATA